MIHKVWHYGSTTDLKALGKKSLVLVIVLGSLLIPALVLKAYILYNGTAFIHSFIHSFIQE